MPGGVIARPAVVADGALVARLADRELEALRPLPRGRAGRRGRAIEADAVADALCEAGADVLAAWRSPLADPGGRPLAVLAAARGCAAVRLPDAPPAAAWVVGWAARVWRAGAHAPAALRTIQALAGAAPAAVAGAGGPPAGPDLERWARVRWRPCALCGQGGLPGAACGGCGTRLPGEDA